jgi:putative OPT family oligopeptide transporter
MGAANVYLGLKAGMTVSAAIPAAVIALAILNGLMGRKSILEANLVQTCASAGEALAAGIIFTMPALVLTGIWNEFDYWTTTLIALSGGLLGVLFMIPMRKVLIVDSELQYPEGVACAEVLRTAEREEDAHERLDTGASVIFMGLGIGAVFKFLQSQAELLRSTVEWGAFRSGRVFFFGADLAPALLGVGAIVGLSIGAQIMLGGVIGWVIAIPLLSEGVEGGDAIEAAKAVWSTRVRYMGVGAMLVGGLVSIWKVRAGLKAAVLELFSQFQGTDASANQDVPPEQRNISQRSILVLTVVTIGLIGCVYYALLKSLGITIVTTTVMVVMSFFFTAVAAYICGLVGSSNSPVSGMTITAVLATGGLMLLFNALGLLEVAGTAGIIATLGVAGIVCCVASTAGDVCNDLKTGLLVGASPRSQQIIQIGGTAVAAFVMAPVLNMLHQGSINRNTGGIGGSELSAPQATLFKNLVEGLFGAGNLPWDMVTWGLGIGVAIALADAVLERLDSKFRLHVMPVAVGIYLPFGVALPILLGGFLRYAVLDRVRDRAGGTDRGMLAASGLIAGESLVGVFVGVLAYFEYQSFKLAERWDWSRSLTDVVSIGAFLVVAAWMCWAALHRRRPSVE